MTGASQEDDSPYGCTSKRRGPFDAARWTVAGLQHRVRCVPQGER